MRNWETRFQVIKEFGSLPVPVEVVLETQSSPVYHIEEIHRRYGIWSQIVCTLEGEGAFRYGSNVYRLTPGRAFIACIGDPEVAYYYPGSGTVPWKFIWMSFRGKQAVNIIEEMLGRYGHVFELPLNKGFVKHLESYKSQSGSIQMVSPIEGAKIVHDALAAFGETVEGNLSASPQAKLTRAAQEMITSNLDRSLDISLIADGLKVTREHLSRIFHTQTGMSPGVFATKERMRAAGRMLMDNRLTCKEIGLRLGYDSQSSFARAFKAYYAMSPNEYKTRGGSAPEKQEVEHVEVAEPYIPPSMFPDECKGVPQKKQVADTPYRYFDFCGELYNKKD